MLDFAHNGDHLNYRRIPLWTVLLVGCAVGQEKEVAAYRNVLGLKSVPSAVRPEPNASLTLTEAFQALMDRKRAVAVAQSRAQLALTKVSLIFDSGGSRNVAS